MRRSRFDSAGYFINDDRCSGGRLAEDDLLGCGHCQKALKRREWREDGGWCSCCDQELCGDVRNEAGVIIQEGCASKAYREGCKNFKEFIYRKIEEQYRQEQNARILGI